jgi:PPIC-type PPIASE domain
MEWWRNRKRIPMTGNDLGASVEPPRFARRMRVWFKDPLLHFLIAGGVLFSAYAWLNPSPPAAKAPAEIRVGPGEVKWLTETWSRQWRREPTPAELRDLVRNLVNEELLAREAKRLGLDENDTIVRRRLAQKLEFLLQDTARLEEPTEDDLRRFYEARTDLFRSAARLTFTQIHFSTQRRKDAAADARAMLARLASSSTGGNEGLGDRLLVDGDLQDVDERTIAASFGPAFARAVSALPPGAWHGPIESGYGWHLVRLDRVEHAGRRPFEEVRVALVERWREQLQRERHERYLESLSTRYALVVDESVQSLIGPTGALRQAAVAR